VKSEVQKKEGASKEKKKNFERKGVQSGRKGKEVKSSL